jgi:hypothetical protein
MGERVTAVDPQTFGSDARVTDYLHKPLWLLVIERTIVWWVKHYWLLFFAVALVWVHTSYGLGWLISGMAVLGGLVVVGLAWIAVMLLVVGGGVSSRVVVMLWKMAVVNYKWNKVCFAAALVNRRGRSVPNIWLLHLGRGCRGVRGYVNSGRLGLPIAKFKETFVKDTICASLPGAVMVRVTPIDAGRGWVEILWEDPLAEIVTPAVLSDGQSLRGSRIPFGIDEDRTVVGIYPERSLLIGGESGSGKSGVVWSLLRGMQEVGTPHELHVIDPKGGIEMGELAGYQHTVNYVSDSTGAGRLVRRVAEDMFKRMKTMPGRKVKISPETPLNVLIIDELLLVGTVLAEGIDGPLGQLLTQGRASGYVVWACSQLGQKSVIGELRDVFVQRVCMAVRSSALTNAVLGDGAEQDGALCSAIPQDMPGIGYVYVEGQLGYRRFRSVYVSDEEIAAIVGDSSDWTPPRRVASPRSAEKARMDKVRIRARSPRAIAEMNSRDENDGSACGSEHVPSNKNEH